MRVVRSGGSGAIAAARCGLFDGIDIGALSNATFCYSRGEAVSDRPGGVPCVGIVLSGLVDVLSSPDGGALTVSTLREGDAFGICNIFAARPLPTTLRCRRAARVTFLTKEQFSSLLREDSDMLNRYLVLCNEKMQFLAAKVELTSLPTCRGRLTRWLLDHSDGGGSAALPGSKEQLARLLGVSRASLFRELSALAREGRVEVQGDRIRLLGPLTPSIDKDVEHHEEV